MYFSLLLLVINTGCTGVKIRTISKPNVDFSQYKSFCWIDGCELWYEGPDYAMSPENMKAIRNSIHDELITKNFSNDLNNPDLLIGFHVIINEQQTTLSESDEMLAPYNNSISYWDEYESYYTQKKLYKFLKSSLVIDIIEAESGSVIWQSTAIKYMELQESLSQKQLKKYISSAMKKFPERI